MKKASAFSPGHVTGLFYMVDLEEDPLYCGSLGAGFSLKKGTLTSAMLNSDPGKDIIVINDIKQEDAPVSRKIISLFFEKTAIKPEGIKAVHNIETPQGSGFGSSGSGALSLIYALNRLYNDPLSAIEASQIAHTAEVLCRTGLGTVMGETMGGFKILIKPGAPGIGKTITIPHPRGLYAMFLVYGPYSTRTALSDPEIRQKIIESGKKYHTMIKQEPVFENFIKYSRKFAESTNLIPESVKAVFDYFDTKDLNISMLMFGEGTFTIVHKDELEYAVNTAEEFIKQQPVDRKPQLFFSNIAKGGVGIVSED